MTDNNENGAVPIMIFICQPNSHPFQERKVPITEAVKVGRAVARIRPAPNNAIFDCKVLSRNHALVSYENERFWLTDTRSSNGTFVNSQRLSKGTEESPPRGIFSGDIIQFGVEVMENSMTHSCIIAQVTLLHPDGTEAERKEENIISMNGGFVFNNYTQEQIYQLEHYLQEALYREQALDKKLETLQKLLENTHDASDRGWQALLNEDRLLAKLELLESQLQIYVKNLPEDALRQEVLLAQHDRYEVERTSKDMLERVLEEKTEALKKMADLERNLCNSEEECNHLREACENMQEEFKQLTETYQQKVDEMELIKTKLQEAETNHKNELQLEETKRNTIQEKLETALLEVESLTVQIEKLEAEKEIAERQYQGLYAQLMAQNADESQDKVDDDDSPAISALEKARQIAMGGENNQQTSNKKSRDEGSGDLSSFPNGDMNIFPHINEINMERQQLNEMIHESMERKDERDNELNQLNHDLTKAELECTAELDRICDIEEQLCSSEFQLEDLADSTIAKLTEQLEESHFQTTESKSLIEILQEELEWLENRLLASSQTSDTGSCESGVVIEDQEMLVSSSSNSSGPLSPGGTHHQAAQHTADLVRIRDLIKQVLTAQSSMQDRLDNYQKQVGELARQRDRMLETQQSITSLEAEQIAHSTMESVELSQLKHEVEELRALLACESISTKSFATRAGNLEEELAIEKYRADKLDNKIAQLKKELSDANESSAVLKQEAEALKEKATSDSAKQSQEYEQLNRECTSLRERIARIEEEKNTSKSRNTELSAEYERLLQEYHKLQAEVSLTDSHKEVENYKDQVDTARNNLRELELRCERYENELSRLRNAPTGQDLVAGSRMVSIFVVIPLMVLLLALMISLYWNLTG